jgi:hypothetical protein
VFTAQCSGREQLKDVWDGMTVDGQSPGAGKDLDVCVEAGEFQSVVLHRLLQLADRLDFESNLALLFDFLEC